MFLDFILFELFVTYLLSKNDLLQIKLLFICKNAKIYIKNDKMYNRKKSAYLLKKNFIDYGFDLLSINSLIIYIKCLKLMKNNNSLIKDFNSSLKTLFDYNAIDKYKIEIINFEEKEKIKDNLDPFKVYSICYSFQVKQQIKKSILLQMSLDHAYKQNLFAKKKELENYYKFGELIDLN